METNAEKFEQWAVVEIMGRNTFAGMVSEQVVAGTAFVRVDVPAVNGHEPFTKLFGGGSIYCITPCSEGVARQVAEQCYRKPVNVYAPATQYSLEYDTDEDGI